MNMQIPQCSRILLVSSLASQGALEQRAQPVSAYLQSRTCSLVDQGAQWADLPDLGPQPMSLIGLTACSTALPGWGKQI